MISVIICSYKKELLQTALKSIEETIGVPYQLVIIDNKDGRYGICKAYNEGASKARYDILCFVHEDITFSTTGWGKNVVAHLSNKQVGLLGVAGGNTKSKVPSGWVSLTSHSEINMVQHYKFLSKPAEHIFDTATPHDKSLSKQVACIDGMWMCTRKDVFAKYKFDEKVFTGFHCYDVDYSLQVNEHYKVMVVFDVLLHHYSEGVCGADWLENTVKLSSKWRNRLPFTVSSNMPAKELVRQHWTVMGVFIKTMSELNYSTSVIFFRLLKYSCNRYFHFMHFMHFLKLTLLHKYYSRQKSIQNT